ncbi:LysE family translocator [Caldalkalibacillus salinus]|uniref:LysE family translocator n=1 Tax=Caldalkalibacillus salinus TaxID=2803787 RepID=UPI0019216261|nr:LysE family translocator [Caldalkalibacillus salinus]
MDLNSILSFLGVAILLTVMPGPDILFVMAQSMSQNSKAGITTALGLCTGLVVHITAATVGISALIYQSAIAFAIVKYAGAAYLLFLAWQAFHEKETDVSFEQQEPKMSNKLFRKGVLMNLLNPKVSLFFLALLPQFVHHETGYVPVQMLLLGLLFLVQAFIVFSLVSIFSYKVKALLLNKPVIMGRINIVKGVLLAMIGLQIALSEK